MLTTLCLSVQGALQWLEDNQDKPLEDIQAAEANNEDDDEDETKAKIAELETGQARSLICNECGKRFRSPDLASYHATKTFVKKPPSCIAIAMLTPPPPREHTDFSESTEEIAPLTDAEKQTRLEELRERLQSKKAAQSIQDKEEQKRNEVSSSIIPKSIWFFLGALSTDPAVENPPKGHERVARSQGRYSAQRADQGSRQETTREAGRHRGQETHQGQDRG